MTLEIKDLHVNVDEKEIISGLNLKVKKGEVHVLMGRNGSGKSTLAMTLMGHPKYKISNGSIMLNKKMITDLPTDERSRMGLFLAFQSPAEVPGVSITNFLRTSYNSQNGNKVPVFEFHKNLKDQVKKMGISNEFIKRNVNESFSGGEKKLNELLQLSILKPKIAILDEIDSGLDIDSLKTASKIINEMKDDMGILIITHYKKVLDYINPDYVHILDKGKIIKSDGKDLVEELEKKGFKWFSENGGGNEAG